MKVGIMQPYFLPYVGYFQLINEVDIFVLYDNIEYTKKGWINRNNYLLNGKPYLFTIPLKKDSDYLNIENRIISESFKKNKLLTKIKEAYNKAPCFKNIFPLIESIVNHKESNLFEFIINSIYKICKNLEINTKIIRSSHIEIDHGLKAEEKVISICKSLNATTYINPIGGLELYDKRSFNEKNLDLTFLKANLNIKYDQGFDVFVPNLSILDLLMHLDKNEIKKILTEYKLIK